MTTTTAAQTASHMLPIDKDGMKILIVSYCLVFTSTIFVATRAITRYRLSRAIEGSDFLLPLALVLAFAQTVCIHLSVGYGMGWHIKEVTTVDFDLYQKATYAGTILYILVLGISKAAIALLIKNVEPQRPVLISCYLALAIVSVWTVSSVVGLGIQCGPPNPWDVREGRCINLSIFYNTLAAINILTDMAIVMLPITLICLLPIDRQKKIWICSLFSTRLLVPIFLGVRIYYLQPALTTEDITYDVVPLQIWTQVVLNTSIITACLPSLGRIVIDVAQGFTMSRRPSCTDVELAQPSSPSDKKDGAVITVQEIIQTKENPEIEPKPSRFSRIRNLLRRTSSQVESIVVRREQAPPPFWLL